MTANITNAQLPKLASMKELVIATGLTKSGINNLIKKNQFPAGVKIGHCRRWNIEDVSQWLQNQETFSC